MEGRLVPDDAPALEAGDSAYSEGRGCFTTARARGGSVLHAERHVQRLVRDARALGLGELDGERPRRALEALARAAFASGEGIVRLQASRHPAGRATLVGTTRPLGPDPPAWSAVVAPFLHEGPGPAAGAKLSGRPRLALARDAARARGAEEALLFDGDGRLVEGTWTNLFVGLDDGGLVTPPLARGAVAGIARALVLERVAGIREQDVTREQLAAARELVATNAVRGARPILRLDGHPVGDGRAGPWAGRLARALEAP